MLIIAHRHPTDWTVCNEHRSRTCQSSLVSVTVTKDASIGAITTREERFKRYRVWLYSPMIRTEMFVDQSLFQSIWNGQELLEYELTGSDEEEENALKKAIPMGNDVKSTKQHVRSSDFEFLKVWRPSIPSICFLFYILWWMVCLCLLQGDWSGVIW